MESNVLGNKSTMPVPAVDGVNIPESVQERGWEDLLKLFLSSIDVKDTSRELYYWGLVQYFKWAEKNHFCIKAMTPADIISFKSYLAKKRLSPLTVSAYLTAVRQFYAWTEANLYYPNIARSVRSPKGKKGFKKKHLTPQEIEALLKFAKARSLRDYAIINLILRTGLRTIEVARADVCDIVHMDGRRVMKIWGKGRDCKDAFVILNDAAWMPIKEYLDSRGETDRHDPLFVTEGKGHRGVRMSPRLIQYLCKECMRGIGLDNHRYSAHSLRHTTAVMILLGGGDWKAVQTVLRHSSPAVSQVYTESIEEEVHLKSNPEAFLENALNNDL